MQVRRWLAGAAGAWENDRVLRLVPKAFRYKVEGRARRDPRYRIASSVKWTSIIAYFTGANAVVETAHPAAGVLAFAFLITAIGWFSLEADRRLKAAIYRDLELRPCWQCGYSTIGLDHQRCPECGTPFDPRTHDRILVAILRQRRKKRQ